MKKVCTMIGKLTMGVLTIIAVFIIILWFGFGGINYFIKPPKPEITYGEFPISIAYEVGGRLQMMEDTIICEFDGFEVLGEAGKYRKWKSRLKSGKNNLTLLRIEDKNMAVEISVSSGVPEYYMGDFVQSKEEYERIMADDRYLGYVQWENGNRIGRSITKEEVWEKYKLKIIDIQYSSPIQNSFK